MTRESGRFLQVHSYVPSHPRVTRSYSVYIRRSAKVILWTVMVALAVLILAAQIVDRFVQFRKTDQDVHVFLSTNRLEGRIGYYTALGRRIRYLSVGADSLPVLFLVHGSPSSFSIYERLMTDTALRGQFRIVAVDRPGYGGSGFGDPEPSIERQAYMLWPLLRSARYYDTAHTRTRKVLLMGGSFGTSVACRLLMDHPGAADGLVLLAPALGPGLEKTYWFSPLIELSWLRWSVPRLFRSANTEKLAHPAELKRMLPLWNRIDVPVFYLQGSADHLVYTTNSGFAQQHLGRCPYLHIEWLPGRPHFFIFSDQPAIVRTILAAQTRCFNY